MSIFFKKEKLSKQLSQNFWVHLIFQGMFFVIFSLKFFALLFKSYIKCARVFILSEHWVGERRIIIHYMQADTKYLAFECQRLQTRRNIAKQNIFILLILIQFLLIWKQYRWFRIKKRECAVLLVWKWSVHLTVMAR